MKTDPTFDELCVVLNYKPKGLLLTNDEAAEILRLKPSALNYKRFLGRGPRFIRNEDQRRVLYSERDVLAYLWAGMRTTTSDHPEQRATA
jgi:hypothetical protein